MAVLWPSASRPYIGGTSDNSVISLIFSRTAGYLNTPKAAWLEVEVQASVFRVAQDGSAFSINRWAIKSPGCSPWPFSG